MSYYSPVMPIEALLYLSRRVSVDPYQLILAHDVNAHPDQYRELLALLPEESIIILDNSLIELGAPVSTYDLWRATTELQEMVAKYKHQLFIVLPDVLLDADATIVTALAAYKELRGDIAANCLNVMIAAQGKTEHQAVECAKVIGSEITAPFLIGVPRILTNMFMTRYNVIELLRKENFNVHMLGMSDNIRDDFYCARQTNVLGIDSASPMRCGYEGKSFTVDALARTMPRENFFELCKSVSDNMLVNYGFVKGMINQ